MDRRTRTIGAPAQGQWARLRDLSLTAGAFALVLVFVLGFAPQEEGRHADETHAVLLR